MSTGDSSVLVKLVDSGQTVAVPGEDIRGRVVEDSNGHKVGTIRHLLIDAKEHHVRMLRLEHGGILGFGATASFIPVEAIDRVTESTVYLAHSGQHITDAPRYDPGLTDQTDLTSLYGYYGYLPFWAPGSAYLPPMPAPPSEKQATSGSEQVDRDHH